MIISVGKTYISRNGTVFRVILKDNDNLYPYRGHIIFIPGAASSPYLGVYTWADNGAYDYHGLDKFDLIMELNEVGQLLFS